MQINDVIIGNMADLESEVAERLESMKRRIKSTCSQTSNIEQKYRQDICSLMKLLKNAYHYNHWDIQGLELQTVNLNDIFGSRKATCLAPEHSHTPKCCLNEPECELENVILALPDVRASKLYNGCETQVKMEIETKNTVCMKNYVNRSIKFKHEP
ncbi:PREDICTED: uncharacterized protein LOC108370964 [Rhagoletis zephyria]|uniref:uncharacterized protein LOC108370964 n=1 Tax=Rhagoletis zephyria TaxID=28612 RepID=UPI0008114FDE|nr:PREDICTED: uncharacterized protein LOC108370964 [Rhagoletis zephyria]XP_036340556.1 uncharacterized protein LOC118749892 isoform X2 [Rhagoletis pomonella]